VSIFKINGRYTAFAAEGKPGATGCHYGDESNRYYCHNYGLFSLGHIRFGALTEKLSRSAG
jgi:hypothetical protein